MMPETVFTLWAVTVAVTAAVFVPWAVYSLFVLWRAARSIQRYAADAVAPARAIAGHTAAIPALDTTIAVAGEILAAAEQVVQKLDTIAQVMDTRASRAN